MSEVLIAPSILNADFGRLGSVLQDLEQAGADWIHLDVMDGSFVPPISFGAQVTKSVREATKLFCDVHLMVSRPEQQFEQFAAAGAQQLSFHIEATAHPHRLVQQVKELGLRVGIALNPATPLAAIEELLDEIDLVVVMTVNPGWGGQQLLKQQLQKVRRLNELWQPRGAAKIQLDGGVTEVNAKECIAAGADVLVAGSSLMNSGDYASTIAQLRGVSRP